MQVTYLKVAVVYKPVVLEFTFKPAQVVAATILTPKVSSQPPARVTILPP